MTARTIVRSVLGAGAATVLVVGLSGAGSAAPGDDVVSVEGSAEGLFIAIDIVVPGEAGTGGADVSPFAAASASDVGTEQFDVEFGPAPTVTLPPQGGGPFTDSLADTSVDQSPGIIFATIGLSEVSTQGALGATGNARSSSTSTDVLLGGLTGFEASEISSECEATAAGGTADTTISDLEFALLPIDLPENPAPNTVLTDADIPTLGSGVTVVLNEQEIVTDATGTHVVVTAFHLTAVEGNQPARGELTLGRSVCGLTSVAPIVVAPTFTG